MLKGKWIFIFFAGLSLGTWHFQSTAHAATQFYLEGTIQKITAPTEKLTYKVGFKAVNIDTKQEYLLEIAQSAYEVFLPIEAQGNRWVLKFKSDGLVLSARQEFIPQTEFSRSGSKFVTKNLFLTPIENQFVKTKSELEIAVKANNFPAVWQSLGHIVEDYMPDGSNFRIEYIRILSGSIQKAGSRTPKEWEAALIQANANLDQFGLKDTERHKVTGWIIAALIGRVDIEDAGILGDLTILEEPPASQELEDLIERSIFTRIDLESAAGISPEWRDYQMYSNFLLKTQRFDTCITSLDHFASKFAKLSQKTGPSINARERKAIVQYLSSYSQCLWRLSDGEVQTEAELIDAVRNDTELIRLWTSYLKLLDNHRWLFKEARSPEGKYLNKIFRIAAALGR